MLGPTASEQELAKQCVYPWCAEAVRVDVSGPDAIFGTAGHEVIASQINAAAPVDVSAIAKRFELGPDAIEKLSRITVGFARNVRVRPGWRAEIAFAYDPDADRGRELPKASHRDYSAAGPNEFAGTVDIVTMDGDLVEITDWKFGRRENVKVPWSNPQLRFLALAAARTYGVERARVRIGFVDDDGGVLF